MFFDGVKEGPPDAIFGLLGTFAADPRPGKVNLLVGIYKDEHLKSELFPSVKKAKERIQPQDLLADFLPIDGYGELLEWLGPVVFGESGWAKERIYAAHSVGGTGALRVGAEFVAQEISRMAYIPNQTWPNHRSIFERAGCKVETYPYYKKRGFDCEGMLAFLEKLPEKSAIVLHACCHNPTGCDPSHEEWREISRRMREKRLFPFFDFAYQGLGDTPEKDSEAVRIFKNDGHEMMVAYSCSKNFSMYCQRVGALFAVTENKAVKERVGSQVKRIARALYSNPPAHGARIVAEVLKDGGLRREWQKDLERVRRRLGRAREELVRRLMAKAKKTDFRYLLPHRGMFSFVDLEKAQAEALRERFAIYVLDNGRINVAGLTTDNLDAVVEGILTVCEHES